MFFFGLTDYAVCLWVSERDDRSVGCGVFIVVGMMATSHNPFVWLRYPVSTCWTCLKTWSVSFLNRVRQLSSQSFPIDRRLPVRRFGGYGLYGIW